MAAPGRCEEAAEPPLIEPQGVSLKQALGSPDWLDLGLQLQAQPLVNASGGQRRIGTWIQQLSFDLTAGSGLGRPESQWREIDHWRSHLQLMLFSGDPNASESIGTAFALQSTAHPTGLWLTEASLERTTADNRLALKLGVLSINPGFVSTPVLDSYVHSALNDTLNLNVGGLPINPYTAPGLQLSWRPDPEGRWGEWRYGVFWLGPEDELASLFGVQPDQQPLQGHTQLLQWTYSQLPRAQALQEPIRRGRQRIARQLPPPLLQLTTGYLANQSEGIVGWTLASTLTLAPELPIGLDNRLWLGLDCGGPWSNDPVPVFVGAGWLSQGILPRRPLDVLALGVGGSRLSPSLYPGQSSETVLELNYSWLVSGNLSLQPVLQLILNPDGRSGTPVLATGLGLELQF